MGREEALAAEVAAVEAARVLVIHPPCSMFDVERRSTRRPLE